jgi:DNA-binding cell septation regulator SpoVG
MKLTKKNKEIIKISDLHFIPINPTAKGILAFTSFLIDDKFCVKNIAIGTSLKRSGELRLIYPYQTLPNGKVVSIFYPITKEIGNAIEKIVLDAYAKFVVEATKRT